MKDHYFDWEGNLFSDLNYTNDFNFPAKNFSETKIFSEVLGVLNYI